MKGLVRSFLILSVIVCGNLLTADAGEAVEKMSKKQLQALTEEQSSARLVMLENRLEEIKSMDLKALPKAEKKALKKEIMEIKKQSEFLSGGVYLSVGAIIIILLVLILIT